MAVSKSSIVYSHKLLLKRDILGNSGKFGNSGNCVVKEIMVMLEAGAGDVGVEEKTDMTEDSGVVASNTS